MRQPRGKAEDKEAAEDLPCLTAAYVYGNQILNVGPHVEAIAVGAVVRDVRRHGASRDEAEERRGEIRGVEGLALGGRKECRGGLRWVAQHLVLLRHRRAEGPRKETTIHLHLLIATVDGRRLLIQRRLCAGVALRSAANCALLTVTAGRREGCGLQLCRQRLGDLVEAPPKPREGGQLRGGDGEEGARDDRIGPDDKAVKLSLRHRWLLRGRDTSLLLLAASKGRGRGGRMGRHGVHNAGPRPLRFGVRVVGDAPSTETLQCEGRKGVAPKLQQRQDRQRVRALAVDGEVGDEHLELSGDGVRILRTGGADTSAAEEAAGVRVGEIVVDTVLFGANGAARAVAAVARNLRGGHQSEVGALGGDNEGQNVAVEGVKRG